MIGELVSKHFFINLEKVDAELQAKWEYVKLVELA